MVDKVPSKDGEGTEGQEGLDGSQTNAGEKTGENESGKGAAAGVDGGGEGGEAGKDGEGNEGEAGQEGVEEGVEGQEGAEGQPTVEERLTEALEKIGELEKKVTPPAQAQDNNGQGQIKELNLTEEQWVQVEEKHGLPRSGIRALWRQNQEIQGLKFQLASIMKNSALEAFGKKPGFADIAKYRDGMEEYLKKFDPSLHSNEKLLEDAYFIAKGKGANASVKKAVNTTERNRKVITKTRPTTGGSNKAGKAGAKELTDEQKSYCRRLGISEADYIRERDSGSVIS